jgi:hypothetical protein
VNIIFTPEKRDRLRKAYENAKHADLDRFNFEGQDYVVSYAKYLLEYLDGKFGDTP